MFLFEKIFFFKKWKWTKIYYTRTSYNTHGTRNYLPIRASLWHIFPIRIAENCVCLMCVHPRSPRCGQISIPITHNIRAFCYCRMRDKHKTRNLVAHRKHVAYTIHIVIKMRECVVEEQIVGARMPHGIILPNVLIGYCILSNRTYNHTSTTLHSSCADI